MVDQTEDEKTAAQKAQAAGLTFEEAPVVTPPPVVTPTIPEVSLPKEEPITPQENVAPHLLDVPHSMTKKPRRFKWLGTLIFVVLLFGLGIWLSSQLRVFVTPNTSVENFEGTISVSPLVFPTPLSSASASIATPSGAVNAWQTVSVSAIGLLLKSVTYQLPQIVVLPTCDGSGCPSSGTNLMGGTRFTVAARGKGERLPDFRKAILTDVNGKEFTMRQTRVGGKDVYEYIGDFVGRTGGGYQFTKMRGVLVPVTDAVSVEFNHFAPVGVVSDFAADDAVFDQIIASIKVPTAATLSPTIKPTVSATSSGN